MSRTARRLALFALFVPLAAAAPALAATHAGAAPVATPMLFGIPVDFILFVCERLIAAGGDENHAGRALDCRGIDQKARADRAGAVALGLVDLHRGADQSDRQVPAGEGEPFDHA